MNMVIMAKNCHKKFPILINKSRIFMSQKLV